MAIIDEMIDRKAAGSVIIQRKFAYRINDLDHDNPK